MSAPLSGGTVPLAGSDLVGTRGRAVVELAGIAHSFDGVVALRGVDLAIYPNEVLGLVGENGAGKSTLVKILTGVIRPNLGKVLVDGVPRRLSSPRAAHELGIAATFQEPMVFPDLDVAENIFATRHPSRLDARGPHWCPQR